MVDEESGLLEHHGAKANKERPLRVVPDGTGDFITLAEAFEALGKGEGAATPAVTIYVAAGTYRERVTIQRPNVTLIGEGAETTRLVYGLGAFMQDEAGEKLGTFRTATLFIDADNVRLCNLTVENDAGDGREVGQALALYADGDCLAFERCHFLGHQDTVFTAPLPLKEAKPGGFRGPKEFAPRRNSRQWYKDCLIAGDVDFIFGGAAAWFEGCELRSLSRHMEPNGYVTAASTPSGRAYGYVFSHCRFTSNPQDSCENGSVYLGRPWRSHAQVVLLSCELGAHIAPAGWWDWNKPEAHTATRYAGFELSGPGFMQQAWEPWTTPELQESEAAHITRDAVLEGWNPEVCHE